MTHNSGLGWKHLVQPSYIHYVNKEVKFEQLYVIVIVTLLQLFLIHYWIILQELLYPLC